MNRYKLIGLVCVMGLSGCAVGPDYVKPPVALSTQFKEATPAQQWKKAEPHFAKNNWWKRFNDPTLNALEDELNQHNQNIANALANYQQAHALVAAARANYFPLITGSLSLTRQKSGISSSSSDITNSTIGADNADRTATSINTTKSLTLDGVWEPDVWGATRRSVEANIDTAQADSALLSSTRLSNQASLAQYYFELLGVIRDQNLLKKRAANYRRIVKLTQNQYQAGTVSRADVLSAQSQLDTSEADIINNNITRAQYEHAIAVLMGRPPANVGLNLSPNAVYVPPIPVLVPSALLERRPDIAQAERLMAAANANIGVQVATYFPVLAISGNTFSSGTSLAKLFSIPAMGWAYGPSLAATILDGGLRGANIRVAKANYAATVATYRQTVLNAFQDVEDNLVALNLLKEQYRWQAQAAKTAQRSYQIQLNQYRAGMVDFNSVLIAEITAYNAEKTALDIGYLRQTAAVGLIKALGGDWDGVVCS